MKWRLWTLSTVLAVGLGAYPAHAAVGGGTPVSDQTAGLYALDGDTVIYQGAADAPQGMDRSGGAPRLYRYNLRTGARSEIATKGVADALTFSGGQIAYTTTSGSLTIQGLDTGKSAALISGGNTVTPQLAGGKLVYARVDSRDAYRAGDFFRYNSATGETRPLGNLAFGTLDMPRPVRFDGQLMTYTENGAPTAMDVESGKIYRQAAYTGAYSVGVGNGQVVDLKPISAAGGSYSVSLWQPVSGGYREMGSLTHPVGVEPAVSGDLLAWADNEGAVRLMDLRTGTARVLVSDGKPKRSVAVSDSFVVYVSDDGKLYAVPVGPAQAAPAAEAVFYTIKPGDLLWKVAAEHSVQLADLVRTNNLLNPNAIWPGQRLYLPFPISPRYETYTVQRGDTLAKVAVRYATTSEAIRQRNGLTSAMLYAGQKLQVGRGPDASGGEYRDYAVMPGDTWQSIARRAGISVAALLKANSLTAEGPLFAAQPIRLPR